MKGKRFKRTQHLLKTVYGHGFGLREPYQILCDASFIKACLHHKIDAREAIPALLGGRVKLMTTACVMAACRAMDKTEHVGAGIAAKRMETRRCNHTAVVSPTECLRSIVEPDNPHHYLVASGEDELKAIVRPIASCPLLLIHKSVLVMEEPTAEVRERVHRGQQGRLQPKKTDLERLKKVFKIEDDRKPLEHRRKRKAKAPNPLSLKKPKVKEEEKPVEPTKKKRIRHRHKPKPSV